MASKTDRHKTAQRGADTNLRFAPPDALFPYDVTGLDRPASTDQLTCTSPAETVIRTATSPRRAPANPRFAAPRAPFVTDGVPELRRASLIESGAPNRLTVMATETTRHKAAGRRSDATDQVEAVA
ncbi:hypothetical protein [Actinokineospora globicatena]|nr:hypothetical protein [Actinokineospora globicatena]